MKRIILALLLAFSAAGAGAEAPPLRPLQLRIVDDQGEPVTGARVQAGNAGEDGTLHQAGLDFEEEVVRAGETSSAGVVRLAGLPLDRAIWVLIEKEGFLPELRSVMLSRRVTCPEIGITLRPGRTVEGQRLDVRLLEESYPYLPDFLQDRAGRDDQDHVHWSELEAPAGPETRPRGHAVVAGRVLAPDGAPIPGAVLFAGGGNSVEAVSADDGSFRLEGLSSGQVPVIARAAGFHGQTRTLEIAGDQARVDFTLTPGEEAITLRGRVLSAAGEPVEGAAVWINNLLVHSARDGSFTLVLPSHWTARWEIQAAKDGYGRGRTSFEVLGKCMTGLEIRLPEDAK